MVRPEYYEKISKCLTSAIAALDEFRAQWKPGDLQMRRRVEKEYFRALKNEAKARIYWEIRDTREGR